MSMYNLVHGFNQHASVLLLLVGLHPRQIPRFRDIWWDGTHIAIHTRTGGGNRDAYESKESFELHYPDDEAADGPWNEDLRQHPGYVSDADDTYDSTYATFLFTPSEEARAFIAHNDIPVQGQTPSERWKAKLKQFETGEFDENTQRAIDYFEKHLKPLIDLIDPERGGENS